ncbi:uncharacterized protein LOC125225293 [Leguminivora glycinivorella]|uniref:uncharacterized protein LOC125225293 n=1 Tax=Leguminivora glycinivorella TaxID=1035111 RepID=UPI00200EBDBA|nr:uncharacterized protein LOC125225293 [Leguminivora glycinivorella]
MPHHLCIKPLQRGPIRNLSISVLKDNDNKEITSQIFNVDMVEVSFKFNFDSQLTPHIRMKASNTNDFVHVTAHSYYQDNVKEQIYNKQSFCSADWLEATMKRIGCHSCINVNGKKTFIYLIDVDITIYKQFPAVSIPNIDKLYEDTEFTDFQLHAADGNVPMHKALLAANSNVFKAMMNGEWKEKGQGQINIEGVTVKTLQHIKDYMYLAMLPDEALELESLLVVAARYLIDKLKADCIKKLTQTVKPENVDRLIKLACQHDLHDLVKSLILNTRDEFVSDYYESQNKKKESSDDGDKN